MPGAGLGVVRARGGWLALRPHRCHCFLSAPCLAVRKQEIIKVTEQLIEAISNGDFESYT